MKLGVCLVMLLASCASAPKTQPQSPPFARISALEDARTSNDGELEALLHDADPAVLERAATALGRMPFPEEGADVTRALLETLLDPHPNVRAAAAFALGVRGDPSAADKLLFVALDHHDADKEALVRARAIEAASKLDRPELRERVLDGLHDSDARVRLETAQGASRWPTTEPNASTVNQRLVDSLANEKDRDVIVYTLFALERRKAKEAVEVFDRFARFGRVEERLFAVRGLAATVVGLTSEERRITALMAATQDSDWRIACEATLGLKVLVDAKTIRAIDAARQHKNPHVRRCAWTTISQWIELDRRRENAGSAWWGGLFQRDTVLDPNEVSRSVTSAMVEAQLRAIGALNDLPNPPSSPLTTDKFRMLLERSDPVERAGVARGLVSSPAEQAASLLELAHDPDFVVREAAIESLAKHPSAETRALLHELLADSDNGIRLSAVTALAEMPDASDLEPLESCYDASSGDISAEIKFNVLRNVAKVGGERAIALLARGTSDANTFVRKVAREELTKIDPKNPALAAPPMKSARPIVDLALSTCHENPMVDVVTTRGTMRFELFPNEAPVHVASFLALAAQGRYKNTLWHRVVPDFVIQGGDYRGDGNGGGTWKGQTESLRHEFTPRKYVRGSLGMPRNEDVDSGGSQIFVTHRPTPHLDGRYTIFGELREGFDVLDTIEVGDKILEVRRIR